MLRGLSIVMLCGISAGPAAWSQEHELGPCQREASTLTHAMLLGSRAIRFRMVTTKGRYDGIWLGFDCGGLELKESLPGKTYRVSLALSDIQSLQVGRQHRAGWRGALIGGALGAALGAAFQTTGSSSRGAVFAAIAFGIDGALFRTTSWTEVKLPLTEEPPPR